MYWFSWKSWFGGQSKSTLFNANPWISTDINDVLWKSMILKEKMYFNAFQRRATNFIWNPWTFHEFEWISVQIYELPWKSIIPMHFNDFP